MASSSALFIRLYLDQDVHPELAAMLRKDGFDCQTTAEATMLDRDDDEQLAYATSCDRCILSFNVRHFAVLAREWAQAGKSHAGIVVTQQVSKKYLGYLHGLVHEFLNTTTADEIRNAYRYL
jgi:predicted nuclease of predicted toxin-antitoxin system